MKRKRSEVKAELLIKAELPIDELLDWDEQTNAPDLTQIKGIVLKLSTEPSDNFGNARV